MKNLLSFFKKERPRPKKRAPGFLGGMRPEQALVWGVAALPVLLAAVLGWDAYLFLQSFQQNIPPPDTKTPLLKRTFSADLDGAITLINERERAFERLLASATATGTPVQE